MIGQRTSPYQTPRPTLFRRVLPLAIGFLPRPGSSAEHPSDATPIDPIMNPKVSIYPYDRAKVGRAVRKVLLTL